MAFAGRTLALIDDPDHRGGNHLMQLPRTECVRRPSSPALLDGLLKSIVAQSSDISRRPDADPAIGADDGFYGIVGKSPAILEIFSRIGRQLGQIGSDLRCGTLEIIPGRRGRSHDDLQVEDCFLWRIAWSMTVAPITSRK